MPFAGALLFSYNNLTGDLSIGANGDAGTVSSGTSDFSLSIANANTAPAASGFTYAVSGTRPIYATGTVVLTRPGANAVPEPGTVVLLALGWSAFALAGRRRRSK